MRDYAGGRRPSVAAACLLHRVPKVHSHIVRQLLSAGAVIFGKTNTPELALKAVTDPQAFGRTTPVESRSHRAARAAVVPLRWRRALFPWLPATTVAAQCASRCLLRPVRAAALAWARVSGTGAGRSLGRRIERRSVSRSVRDGAGA